MTTQEILNQNWTKTKKIQQLILLGLTRREIAVLVTNNNYGFVQNVYAKMREQGLLSHGIQANFNRKFGVEIEAYNVTRENLLAALSRNGVACVSEGYNHTTRSTWKIVGDGSLSGTNTFELVSPILQGEAGIQELEKVCKALEECNAKVNKSCGLHIHFDGSAFNLDAWKRIYINYSRLEGIIDSFMPTSRRANNNYYCKSLTSVTNLESRIRQASNLNEISSVFGGNRYFKVNPTSYSRHNTVEFRQHSGTVEFKKIKHWVKFLNDLVTISETRELENATVECLGEFCQPELIAYINERIQKLR